MLCKQCRYSLMGLETHRCPECGLAFDPADPATFQSNTKRRLTIKDVAFTLVLFFVLDSIVAALMPRWGTHSSATAFEHAVWMNSAVALTAAWILCAIILVIMAIAHLLREARKGDHEA